MAFGDRIRRAGQATAHAASEAGRPVLGALFAPFRPIWLIVKFAWDVLARIVLGVMRAVRHAVLFLRARRAGNVALSVGALAFVFYFIAWPAFAAFWAYVYPVVSRVADDRQWTEFERGANRAGAVALLDAEGRYFGILSSAFDRDHLGGLPRMARFGDLVLFPDHKSIPVEDAPEYFWRCLVYLEDRGRSGWDNPAGVSFRGLARILYSTTWQSIRGGRLSLGSGGSTIEMQIARSIWMQYPGQSTTLTRKIAEWRAAPVLRRHLTEDGDDRRLRAWAAQHIALVQAAGGEKDIFGVETASRFLFGHGAVNLSAEEQLLLAAAVHQPFRMRRDVASRRTQISSRVGVPEAPGRALRCADAGAIAYGLPVIPDADLRARTYEGLLTYAERYDGPQVHPDLAPHLTRLIEHPAGPRLDPQRIASEISYGLQTEIVGQLADVAGEIPRLDDDAEARDRHPWRGRVTEARLTLDLAKNLALAREIDAAVDAVEASVARDPGRNGVLVPGVLGAPHRGAIDIGASADGAADRAGARRELGDVPFVEAFGARAPLLVVAVDGEGRVVRLINTGVDSYLFGVASERPDIHYVGDGPYAPERAGRQLASLGKIGAAMLLAEAGLDDPGLEVSNRCKLGIRDNCMGAYTVDGRPAGGRARVTIADAFAESLNAATIEALEQAGVSWDRIDALMADFEFRHLGDERDPRQTSLVLGRYAGRGQSILTLTAAAMAMANGEFDAEVHRPRLIEHYRAFDPVAARFVGEGLTPYPDRTISLADVIARGEVDEDEDGAAADAAARARFVRTLLEAPLCTDGADGQATLRRLRALGWCAADRPDVTMHIAKTGTLSSGRIIGGHNEADWLIAGAVQFTDGRRYTYLVAAGLGNRSAPFARDLGAGRLAPVVDALLNSLAND